MIRTHELIFERGYMCALGNGNYFSWHIIPEFGEWNLFSIYGANYGSFKTLKEVLDKIGFEE